MINKIKSQKSYIFTCIIVLFILALGSCTANVEDNEFTESSIYTGKIDNHSFNSQLEAEITTPISGEDLPVDKNQSDELVWMIAEPYEVVENEDSTVVDELRKTWEDKLNSILESEGVNYHIRMEGFAATKENMFNMKNNDQTVDLISFSGAFHDSDENAYQLSAKEGILQPLSGLLDSEETTGLRNAISEADIALATIDGEIFGLSTLLPTLLSTSYDPIIFDEMEIAIDEIDPNLLNNHDFLVELKETYNRVPIIVPYISDGYDLGLYILQPCDAVALGESGEFENLFRTELYRNRVKEYLSLKEEGLLEIGIPDSNTLVNLTYQESFTTKPYVNQYTFIEDGELVEKEVVVIPDTSRPILQLYWGDWKTGIASWSEKVKKLKIS